jgi:hypothetical protein
MDITVSNINQPPLMASVDSQEVAEGVLLSFIVSAADPDGTTPTLTTSALPGGAQFVDSGNGVGSFEWTPGFDQSGVYPVTFYATDDSLAIDSSSMYITVANINQPPELSTVDPQTANAGVLFSLSITASDPDNDSLALSSESLPLTATFIDSGNGVGVFQWTPAVSDTGIHNVTFVASDGALDDTILVAITVPWTGCCIGIRGNVNYDASDDIDIADLTYLVEFLFGGGVPPACIEEADLNASGAADISDLTYLVDYLFGGGPQPHPCP